VRPVNSKFLILENTVIQYDHARQRLGKHRLKAGIIAEAEVILARQMVSEHLFPRQRILTEAFPSQHRITEELFDMVTSILAA
jgi:hypothetical protein